MIRSLVAGLAAGVLAFSGGAHAAGPRQSLGIVLHRDAAATEGLPQYSAATPIDVNVSGDAAHLPSLTAVALGPGGEAIATPLARSGNTYTGNLQLTTPGTWTLALSTQLGSASAALASVPLDVVSEAGPDLVPRLALALSLLSIAGGLVLLVRVARRPFAPARARKRS